MSDEASSWSPFDGVDLDWWETQATAGAINATVGPLWGASYSANSETGQDPAVSDLREDLSRADGCDRSSFLGKMGICEVAAIADDVVEYVGYVAPVAMAALGVAGLALALGGTVVLLNYSGAAPVLQETGKAFAKGINRGAKSAFGGR